MPDELAESRVLTLRLESRNVGGYLGSVLQAGSSGLADSTETGAILLFGLRDRRTGRKMKGA